MDLNHQYAAHQQAVMRAAAVVGEDRCRHLGLASSIASSISEYQAKLGAAAACAWSHASLRAPNAACGA